MTEQKHTGCAAADNTVQYGNPTVQKVMKGMEFVLQLCRLIKSLLNRIFLWIDKWENGIQKHTSGDTEQIEP